MNGRRATTLLVATLVLMTAAACASASEETARSANTALPTTSTSTTTTTATTSAPDDTGDCGPADQANLTKSYRPPDVQPGPGELPFDAYANVIAHRGVLQAGVDENTLPLSFRNPRTGGFEGFEIDLLREIAQAIGESAGTAPADILKPVPVVTEEKVSVVANGDVDLTASAVSINCERWRDVLFTIPYYVATQKVMVRTDRYGRPVLADGTPLEQTSDVAAIDRALDGRRVCATANSTSKKVVEEALPHASVLPVRTRTDCLVALQDGTADAILLHDTFLLGFANQDPNTTILPLSLDTTEYGIAVAPEHPDFVGFLNRILLDMRENGRLEELYDTHFTGLGAPADLPALPPAEWID
jgi:polar amino acid transport system substrate-binding protein